MQYAAAAPKTGSEIAWARIPGYLLFFTMLFVPTTYQPIKAILLALTLATILAPMLWNRRLDLHPSVLVVTMLMALTGLFFVGYGLIRGTPGALRVSTVYVLWPLLYLLFVGGVARKSVLESFLKLLVFGSICVSAYCLIYVLTTIGWLPKFLYIELDQDQRIAFFAGFIKFNIDSLTTLLYTVPFLLTALISWSKELNPPVSRVWLWTALLMGVVVILLSGRRALWIILFISPFLALAFRQLLPGEIRKTTRKIATGVLVGLVVGGLGIYGYITYTFHFDITGAVDELQQGFEFNDSTQDSPFARQQQFLAMKEDLSASPILGYGHGAVAHYSVRSEDTPWAYELAYLALMLHTGLLGFTLYLGGVVWIYRHGCRMIRSGTWLGLLMLPVLVGMTAFLIGNATNPYLEKYDFLWVIFLPVAFINRYRIEQDEKQSLESAEQAIGNKGP